MISTFFSSHVSGVVRCDPSDVYNFDDGFYFYPVSVIYNEEGPRFFIEIDNSCTLFAVYGALYHHLNGYDEDFLARVFEWELCGLF